MRDNESHAHNGRELRRTAAIILAFIIVLVLWALVMFWTIGSMSGPRRPQPSAPVTPVLPSP